jgi:hypothetical protein
MPFEVVNEHIVNFIAREVRWTTVHHGTGVSLEKVEFVAQALNI